MMSKSNRVDRFARFLKKKRCAKCHSSRLIQKRPRIYNEVRCLNCGAVGRVHENISQD